MHEIEVDSKAFLKDMKDVRDDQVPFALKTALNDVGLSVQSAERAHMHEIFEDRQPQWIDKSAKITHFATKREPWLTIGVHPPGADGESRKDIITKFEDDREKRPFKGKYVAVPTGAKRNKKDIVRAMARPAAFNFHRVGNRILGDSRTFIVKKGPDLALILQRVYRGARSQVRSLYLLLRRVPIQPDLEFEATAGKVVTRDVEAAFTRRMDEAMRSAK